MSEFAPEPETALSDVTESSAGHLSAFSDREMLEQIYTSLTILVEDVNAIREEIDSIKDLVHTAGPIMDSVMREVETKGIMGLMPLITGAMFRK